MEPVLLAQIARPDPTRDLPLVVQIYRDLRSAILMGSIANKTQLPSSRTAATAIGVSRNTLNEAYDLLRAEGLISIRPNRRPVVSAPSNPAPQPRPRPKRINRQVSSAWTNDPRAGAFAGVAGLMAPGQPDHSLFPHNAWGRALRRASRSPSTAMASFGANPNHAPLRALLADQLARDRGMAVEAENILITSSTQTSLSLAVHVLTRPGDTVMFENPGYLGARAVFIGAQLKLKPFRVTDKSARLSSTGDPPRLIYLTPSNQFPMGTRLSQTQRLALIDHARTSGAMIIEDDYDSEFLWRGREIAAMHALDGGESVIYLGTTSKTMMLGMRLGWMVVPHDLLPAFTQAQRNLGASANVHVQAAMAEFLDSGAYRAHLRKITRTYAERRQELASALTKKFGESLDVRAPDGGLQMAILFRAQQKEEVCLTALSKAGFLPGRLSAYCMQAKLKGLVVGIADATAERIKSFCAILAKCG